MYNVSLTLLVLVTCLLHVFSCSVNYLDKHLSSSMMAARGEEWQPLLVYRNSLVQGEHEIRPITLKQAAQRRYGKRKVDRKWADGGALPVMCDHIGLNNLAWLSIISQDTFVLVGFLFDYEGLPPASQQT